MHIQKTEKECDGDNGSRAPPRVSGGGGQVTGGSAWEGGAGSGLGQRWGAPRSCWGFKPKGDTVGFCLERYVGGRCQGQAEGLNRKQSHGQGPGAREAAIRILGLEEPPSLRARGGEEESAGPILKEKRVQAFLHPSLRGIKEAIKIAGRCVSCLGNFQSLAF